MSSSVPTGVIVAIRVALPVGRPASQEGIRRLDTGGLTGACALLRRAELLASNPQPTADPALQFATNQEEDPDEQRQMALECRDIEVPTV